MEQITVTLNREALEQLPTNVLVNLLMGQQTPPTPEPPKIAQLAKDTNEALLSLFPAEEMPKPKQGKNTNRPWKKADDLALIYGYSKGHLTFDELAERLGRNYQGIKMRVYRLKLDGRL